MIQPSELDSATFAVTQIKKDLDRLQVHLFVLHCIYEELEEELQTDISEVRRSALEPFLLLFENLIVEGRDFGLSK